MPGRQKACMAGEMAVESSSDDNVYHGGQKSVASASTTAGASPSHKAPASSVDSGMGIKTKRRLHTKRDVGFETSVEVDEVPLPSKMCCVHGVMHLCNSEFRGRPVCEPGFAAIRRRRYQLNGICLFCALFISHNEYYTIWIMFFF